MNYIKNIPKRQLWFSLVFLVSGILFWVSILGLFGRKGSAVLALSLGLIWLTCAGFGMLFLDKKLLFINYLILGILVVVLFGFMAFNMWGVLIFMASIVWAHNRAERMRDSLSHFRVVYIARKFYPIYLTGLAILLAFVWQSFSFGQIDKSPQISQKFYHAIFVPVESIISGLIPGYQSGMTIGEAQGSLQEGFFSKILSADSDINKLFGNTIAPQTQAQKNLSTLTIEDFTRIWINTSIQNTFDPYIGLAPFFVILGLFLVLKLAFWYLKWIVLGMLFIVIKLMETYNVLTIKEIQTTTRVPVLE